MASFQCMSSRVVIIVVVVVVAATCAVAESLRSLYLRDRTYACAERDESAA